MKKYILSISLALLFFVSYAGTVNHFSNKTALIASQINEGDYSTDSFKYPHTELEISQHTVTISNSGRTQSFAGFIDVTTSLNPDDTCFLLQTKEQSPNFSYKNYLSHIYPSHNFW